MTGNGKNNDDDVVAWPAQPSMAANRAVGAGRGATSIERQVEEGQLVKPASDGRLERYKGLRVQTNVRLPPEVKRRLEKLARRHKSNLSATVEVCIEHYLAAEARRGQQTD